MPPLTRITEEELLAALKARRMHIPQKQVGTVIGGGSSHYEWDAELFAKELFDAIRLKRVRK